MILAGDVGATKILLEVGRSRSGRWETALVRRFATEDAASLEPVLDEFLRDWRAKPGARSITAAAFGVAGPVEDNRVKMTNRPWVVDGARIARRFRIPRVRVVNDLAAIAHGIPWIGPKGLATIQAGRASESDPRVVIGVGTGLGIAYLVPANGTLNEVAGEGGHMGFGPATLEQAELWRWIFDSGTRVSAESILSGHGLARVHAYVRAKGEHPGKLRDPSPEQITEAGLDGSDAACGAALNLFVECLGTVAGDHALATMARGGVYLAGGIVAKIVPRLQHGRFRDAFCAKPPHSAILARIPVRAVTAERVGMLGAARLAQQR